MDVTASTNGFKKKEI